MFRVHESRRFWSGLAVIAILAAGLRLWAIVAIPTQPLGDFWSYHQRAVNWLDTGVYGIVPGQADAMWPPLYPLSVAGALHLAGRDLVVAKGLNAGLGVLTVLLVGCLGRRFGGNAGGWFAAFLLAIYPRAVLQVVLIASENLFVPLLFGWALALLTAVGRQAPTWRPVLVGGLLAGLAASTRAAAGPLFVAWALATLPWFDRRRSWRRWGVELLVVVSLQLLVLLPWALRNERALGEFSWTTSSSGMSLFLGNNPRARGEWYLARDQIAEILAGVPSQASPFEEDRAFRGQALAWMVAEPGAAATLYVHKLKTMFRDGRRIVLFAVTQSRNGPEGQQTALPAGHPARRNAATWIRWCDFAWWLLASLEFVAVAVILWRGDAAHRRMSLALIAASALLVGLGALFFGNPRFRWPSVDLMVAVTGCLAGSVVWLGRQRTSEGQRDQGLRDRRSAISDQRSAISDQRSEKQVGGRARLC